MDVVEEGAGEGAAGLQEAEVLRATVLVAFVAVEGAVGAVLPTSNV